MASEERLGWARGLVEAVGWDADGGSLTLVEAVGWGFKQWGWVLGGLSCFRSEGAGSADEAGIEDAGLWEPWETLPFWAENTKVHERGEGGRDPAAPMSRAWE